MEEQVMIRKCEPTVLFAVAAVLLTVASPVDHVG
jgi:hypothetical protein